MEVTLEERLRLERLVGVFGETQHSRESLVIARSATKTVNEAGRRGSRECGVDAVHDNGSEGPRNLQTFDRFSNYGHPGLIVLAVLGERKWKLVSTFLNTLRSDFLPRWQPILCLSATNPPA